MDGGDSSKRQRMNNSISSNGINTNTIPKRQRMVKREDHHCLPMSNVNKIIRNVVPSNVEISDAAKNYIQLIVSKYVSAITSQAYNKCHNTITLDDIMMAMRNFTFADHLRQHTCYQNDYPYGQPQSTTTVLPGEPSNRPITAEALSVSSARMNLPMGCSSQPGVGAFLTPEDIERFIKSKPSATNDGSSSSSFKS